MKPITTRYIENPKYTIPKNSKIIFESKLFRIYKYPQKLLNGKTTMFEAVTRQDNAQIILINNNKIILTKELQPQYKEPLIGIPGGNVEWDETPENGAIRETFEETGIKANKIKLFATDNIEVQKLIRNFYLYIGWGKGILKAQNTESEQIELLELTFEDFIKETQKPKFRNPNLKKIIKDIINRNELERFKKLLFNNQ